MVLIDLKRFAKSFYYAAKAYFYHRFNALAVNGYFYDALHHYYFITNKTKFDNYTILRDNWIRYYGSILNISTTISYLGQPIKLQISDGLETVPLETFILHIGSLNAQRKTTIFPPIKPFIAFDHQNRKDNFQEQLFSLNYPINFEIFSRLSYDIKFLQNWIHSDHVSNHLKIIFILGYDSGIQKTLTEFLEKNNPLMKKLIDSIPGEIEPELLQYLRSGRITENTKSHYGNYTIRSQDFSEILQATSDLKFANPVERIEPGPSIPSAELNDIDKSEEKFLGSGSYGEVYAIDNSDLVIKVFDDDNSYEGEIVANRLLRRYMNSFRNVSQIQCYDETKKFFQMEKLFPLPRKVNPFVPLNGNLPIFLQMVHGLYEMHSCGIAHNDIKLANVLQTAEGQIKFIDFGLARLYCNKVSNLVEGTYTYNPPELCFPNSYPNIQDNPQREKLMPAHDMWSTIVTVYEVFVGESIYILLREFKLSDEEIMLELMKCLGVFSGDSKLTKLFDLIDQDDIDLRKILRSCVHHDPFQRATALEVLQSPYGQRYLSDFTPLAISPCLRLSIIDGNPFAGYRSREERKNWIVLCDKYHYKGVKYAPMFECRKLPKVLGYLDYLAIFYAVSYEISILEYHTLPHPVPMTINGQSHNLINLIYRYRRYFIDIPKLSTFHNHGKHDDIVKILTQGYLAGKCENMSALEILAE